MQVRIKSLIETNRTFVIESINSASQMRFQCKFVAFFFNLFIFFASFFHIPSSFTKAKYLSTVLKWLAAALNQVLGALLKYNDIR